MSGPTESAAVPPEKAAGRRARISAVTVAVVLLGAAGVALLLGIRDYPHFFVDDAFISLRYADRLLEGKGLTYTDGERGDKGRIRRILVERLR